VTKRNVVNFFSKVFLGALSIIAAITCSYLILLGIIYVFNNKDLISFLFVSIFVLASVGACYIIGNNIVEGK
jgi:hypothetical protein